MSVEDNKFKLLMSEKDFADSQIGGFFELQVKVLAFLSATVVLLGWLYSDKAASSTNVPIIAVVLVVIDCSVLLQGIIMYASSLGYLEYKITTLNREFAQSLGLRHPPFTSFWAWKNSCTRPPVAVAVFASLAMHIGVNGILLHVAGKNPYPIPSFHYIVAAAAIYLAITCLAEGLVINAQRRLMLQEEKYGQTTSPSDGKAKQPDVTAENSMEGSLN